LPKIEWVARSMIGQWIYVFYHRRHPNVRNRPTILVSLQYRGPYQCNGASLVFLRCVAFEIQILFGRAMTGNKDIFIVSFCIQMFILQNVESQRLEIATKGYMHI